MKNSKIIYEIALKAFPDFAAQESLNEVTVVGILNEDLSNSDVKKLRGVILETSKAVKQALAVAKDFNMKSLVRYFENLLKSLSESLKLASELDLEDNPTDILSKISDFFNGNPAKVSDALQVVMNLENKASVALNAVADSLDFVLDNLEGKGIDGETSIKDISQESLGVPVAKFQKAIANKIRIAIKKPEGFMGKISKFFGKDTSLKQLEIALGADVELDPELVSKDIMNLTYSKLKGTASESQEAAKSATDSRLESSTAENIASSEGSDSEEGKQPGEESTDPTSEIKAVAAEAESNNLSPKDAVSKALDDWEKSLSPSSQQTIRRKKRNVALKDAIFTGIDKGTVAVKKAVAKAVKDWRTENEEVLIKGKRFAKKNFDSLEQLIPALTAQVLAQTKESKQRKITVLEIKNFVFKRLNSEFNPGNLLHEKWVKNAGLLKE